MNKKIMIIVNPVSAGGKTAKIWPKKRKYLKKELKNFTELYTKKSNEAVEFAKNAVETDYDYIIAVGGDGTVNEIINGMLAAAENNPKNREKHKNLIIPKTKLIIFAHGTGSDFSRSLKLSNDIKKFIELIKRENSRNIRILSANYFNNQGENQKRYFINIADCGMGAEVAKKLNNSQKSILRSINYLLKIFKTLLHYQNKRVTIIADKEVIYQGKINSVVIANGSYFGGGIKIAPAADLSNKKLNLVILKNFSKYSIIFNLIKAYRGNHLSHPLVDSYLLEEVRIKTEIETEVELDGESVGICNASFQISNKAISVLT